MTEAQLILVDDVASWPPDLLSLFRSGARLDSPDFVSDVEAALAERSILGWHCTRLHEAELRAVIAEGLKPSDVGLLTQRIGSLEASGEISPEHAALLRSKNQAGEFGRANKVWFIFVRHMLSDGTERFFRSWGGECLYNSHERDPVLGPLLRSIGEPCILECCVPIAGTKFFYGIGETLANAYRRHGGIRSSSPRMEGYASRSVAVSRVILSGEVEFTRLTERGD